MQLKTELKLGAVIIRVNWIIGLFVLMTFGTFVRLGIWQIDRAGEKVALQEALQAERQQAAVALDDLPDRMDTADLQGQHVVLEGEFLNERVILLAPRIYNTAVGYEVVTPFRLQSNGQLVLVNRGWIPVKHAEDSALNLQPVAGFLKLTAQIHIPEVSLVESQGTETTWPIQMRFLNIEYVSLLLGEEVFPYPVRMTEGQTAVLVRNWPAVNVDISVNLGYALQWFFFALVVLIGSLLASSNILALARENEQSEH